MYIARSAFWRAILMIKIMIKITVTVFNFSCSASLSRGSGPLEMRKVEMGNGIGCITCGGKSWGGGEWENVAKARDDRAGWLSRYFRRRFFVPRAFYTSRPLATLSPLMSHSTEGASNFFDLNVNWRRYVRTRDAIKVFVLSGTL